MHILLSTTVITVICVLAVVVVIVLIAVLSVVLYRKHCKKKYNQLLKEYDYYHSLLTGQDAQYIQRLDIISRSNLLYSEKHAEFFKRFKEIRDTQDKSVDDILNMLQGYLESKKYSEFNVYLKEHQIIIDKYKESVNELNKDLEEIIKPEEDYRQQELTLKEKYRQVKSVYNQNEQGLVYVQDSFKKVFDVIEAQFNKIDMLLESADYDEVGQLIPKLGTTLDELYTLARDFPAIIERANKKIPVKIRHLETRYKTLVSQDYPLSYLKVDSTIESMNNALDEIARKIKNLEIDGINGTLNNIESKIDQLEETFKNEESAKADFDERFSKISSHVHEIENEFINISNNIHKFKKIYLMDEEHENQLNTLQNQIDKIDKDKRNIERQLHSSGQTPYSYLINSSNILDENATQAETSITSFKNYQTSLKEKSESAFANLEASYPKVKEYESRLSRLLHPEITEKYESLFDEIYSLMDQLNDVISKVPIDVDKASSLNAKLETETNKLYEEANNLLKYEEKARNNIMLINRDRTKFSDVDSLLTQAENQYNDGEYKVAYDITVNILDKLKAKSSNILTKSSSSN